MIAVQLTWIFDNSSHMLTTLNIAFATISIITKMWYLLYCTLGVIFLPLRQISLVVKFFTSLQHIAIFLSKLIHHLHLLSHICVVRIYKHELVVVCYVKVLISSQVFLKDIQLYSLFLDQELCIFMIIKRTKVIVPVITIVL